MVSHNTRRTLSTRVHTTNGDQLVAGTSPLNATNLAGADIYQAQGTLPPLLVRTGGLLAFKHFVRRHNCNSSLFRLGELMSVRAII